MPDRTEPPTSTDTAVEVVRSLVSKVPVVGDAMAVVVRDAYARRVAKAEAVALMVAEQSGGAEHLAGRLGASPELEALFFAAVEAGARTGLEDKRRLLGRVVSEAVLDDAKVDEAQLLVQVLGELDAPHLRGLETVRRASDVAYQPDGYEVVSKAVEQAVAVLPEPLQAALVRTGTLYVGTGMMAGTPRITKFGRDLLDDLRAAADGG